MSTLTPWQLYSEMLYLGSGITGSCPYGDAVPSSWPEQVLGTLAQIWSRVFLAYFNSQFASYFGTLYSVKARREARQERTVDWMKQNQISEEVRSSYKQYEANLIEIGGIDEEKVLKGLPRMLRFEVRLNILQDNIKHWEPL